MAFGISVEQNILLIFSTKLIELKFKNLKFLVLNLILN